MGFKPCPTCGRRMKSGAARARCSECRYPPFAPALRERLEAGILAMRAMDADELIRRIADGLSDG